MSGNDRASGPVAVGLRGNGDRAGRVLARLSGRTQTLTSAEFVGLGLVSIGLAAFAAFGFYAKDVDRRWVKNARPLV